MPYLKVSAVADETTGGLSLFLLNRDLKQEIEVSLDVRGFGGLAVKEALELRHDDLKAVNTKDAAGERLAQAAEGRRPSTAARSGSTLKPASWNVIRLEG